MNMNLNLDLVEYPVKAPTHLVDEHNPYGTIHEDFRLQSSRTIVGNKNDIMNENDYPSESYNDERQID
jgi:hypothetical protein